MTTAFEDRDLIAFFSDGLARAVQAIKPSPVIVLYTNTKEIVSGLKNAIVAANGLAHTQHNPAWLAVRDLLENTLKYFMAIARNGHINMSNRQRIADLLEKTMYAGRKMATSKAMPRQDVLANLALRKTNHEVER